MKVKDCQGCKHCKRICWSHSYQPLNYHAIGMSHAYHYCEKHGLKVFLCGKHHNLSDDGVHFNHELDLHIKRECQAKFEETHSREEFMAIIGKNYLD